MKEKLGRRQHRGIRRDHGLGERFAFLDQLLRVAVESIELRFLHGTSIDSLHES